MRLSFLPIIVTLLILYFAITQLDWVALFQTLQNVNPAWIVYALGVWVIVITCKSAKWMSVVSALGGNVSLGASAKTLLIGLFVGVITPGRVGDFVRATYVKNEIGLGKGIMGVFIDRVMDVITLLLFATIGLIILVNEKGIHLISNETLALVFVLFIVGVLLALDRRVARGGWKYLQRWLPVSIRDSLSKYGGQFYDSIPLLRKKIPILIGAFVLGILAWVVAVVFGFFLLQAANVPVGLDTAFLIVPILALTEIIPLGIGGIGTREVAAVIVLGAYGIPPESAVVFSLLYFAFGYIPSFVLGALAFTHSPIPIEGGIHGIVERFRGKK